MAEKNCKLCFHYVVCYAVGSMPERAETCSKYASDVEEVKHEEWELKSEIRRFFEEIDEEFYVECPFCHRVYYVPFEFENEKMLEYAKENYPYCNCGAKMDGRSDT